MNVFRFGEMMSFCGKDQRVSCCAFHAWLLTRPSVSPVRQSLAYYNVDRDFFIYLLLEICTGLSACGNGNTSSLLSMSEVRVLYSG